MARPRKYQIWDKVSDIDCYTGDRFTAEQWIAKYPIINKPGVVPIVEAGEVPGGFFGTLSQLKRNAEAMGAEFDPDLTDEELLQAIEDFEDEMNTPDTTPSAEERTAAALEFLAMSNLPDEV